MAKVTHIALLRGINVGGHKIIKMEQLRKSCSALGWESVQTYVQSGNVVFQAPRQSANALSEKLQERILRDFGFSVAVIVRTADEISKAIRANPFLKKKGIDAARLYVTFLSRAPEKAALAALEKFSAPPDEFCCLGQEIFLYLPNGSAKTKLSINTFEKLLAVSATTRNWNTVNKLHAMSSE
jgi:uncharacterized protein (DUF1697 family)